MKITLEFSWTRVLKYFTWLSIICFLIAAVLFFSCGRFLKLIRKIPVEIWIGLSFSLSTFLYGASYCLCNLGPEHRWIYFAHNVKYIVEFLNGLGSISFLLLLFCITYHWSVKLEKKVDLNVLTCAAFFCYGFVGYMTNSSIAWVASQVSLGVLFNVVTGYSHREDHATYSLGIFKPKLVCMLGIILIFFPFSGVLTTTLSTITQTFGCLYFFISLWILSLFEKERLLWNFAFIGGSILVMSIGLKIDDHLFSRFGLVFLLIEFYTLYFENFWGVEYKSLFFLILGLTFAGIAFFGKHVSKYFVKK